MDAVWPVELAVVPLSVADAVVELESLPSCVSIASRSAENACIKADTLLVAAGEPLLAMLLLAELEVVVAFEPVVAWLCHCHQFE